MLPTSETFHNPILSGFYPDPSICRVGEDYYMATSSFIYFPGIPIFHSRDLVHWEQLGHAIHRRDQLDYRSCEASLGLWAPTIRYHDGLFYVINTFVSEGREVNRDNYIVTAKDPAGPWSDPVFIKGADGIDSSLFWDEDGRMWYTGNYIEPHPQYEGHHGIYLQELDPATFQFIGERIVIWDGARTTGKWIEAPHLYHIHGYYYLIVAEGGTFSNHCVMMARAERVEGPYEICPRNPILTHRHLPLTGEISVTGHADLVETQNGEWWMVLLAVRPYVNREASDQSVPDQSVADQSVPEQKDFGQGDSGKDDCSGKFHFNTGRETFLVPFHWEKDGWPLIDTEGGMVHRRERRPALPECILPGVDPMEQTVLDHFDAPCLDLRWNTIQPPATDFWSLSEHPGCLRLKLAKETLWKTDLQDRWHTRQPACICRRQQHQSFEMAAGMRFTPAAPEEEAGIVLLQDDRFSYLLTVGCSSSGKIVLRLAQCEEGLHTILAEMSPADAALPEHLRGSGVILGSSCRGRAYDFWYALPDTRTEAAQAMDPGRRVVIAESLPAELLSTNVNHGFTGAYVGMYASASGAESSNAAEFDWFLYRGGRI